MAQMPNYVVRQEAGGDLKILLVRDSRPTHSTAKVSPPKKTPSSSKPAAAAAKATIRDVSSPSFLSSLVSSSIATSPSLPHASAAPGAQAKKTGPGDSRGAGAPVDSFSPASLTQAANEVMVLANLVKTAQSRAAKASKRSRKTEESKVKSGRIIKLNARALQAKSPPTLHIKKLPPPLPAPFPLSSPFILPHSLPTSTSTLPHSLPTSSMFTPHSLPKSTSSTPHSPKSTTSHSLTTSPTPTATPPPPTSSPKLKTHPADSTTKPRLSATPPQTDVPRPVQKRLRSKPAVPLPMSRVKTIMRTNVKSSAQSTHGVSQDSVALVAKATEFFIAQLAREAHKVSVAAARSEVSYNDLSSAVNRCGELKFLQDIVPEKVVVRDYLASLGNQPDHTHTLSSSASPTVTH